MTSSAAPPRTQKYRFNGKEFTLPEGTTDEQIEEFIRSGGAGEVKPAPEVVGPPAPAAPERTTIPNAAVGGFTQGLTYGGEDEVTSAIRAGTAPTDAGFVEDFQRNQRQEQGIQQQYETEHPVPYYGGQVGGAVAGSILMPQTIPGRVAGATRGAVEGATQGYLSGDTVPERVTGAAIGGLAGAAGGLIGPSIGNVASKIALKYGRPIIDFAAGLLGGPGGRRVAAKALVDAGVNPDEAEQFIQEALQRGQKLTPADVGGRPASLSVQTAGTLNPEARMVTQELIDERNATRGQRFRDYLTTVAPGFGNTAEERDLLRTASQKANQGNYKIAYDKAPSLLTPELQDMMNIPAVKQAIADVTEKSANRAGGTPGAKPVQNPFTKDADGNLVLKPGATPSLEFWDHVARNLSDQAEDAGKGVFGGKSGPATDITNIRRRLVSELDTKVPEFGAARGEALKFFNANDALDLGTQLAGDSTLSAENFQRGIASLSKLSGVDKRLAQAGYLDALSHKAGKATNNADISRLLLGSDNDKLVQEALFGPKVAKDVAAFVKGEGLMQAFATRAAGGSPTAERSADLLRKIGAGAVISGGAGAAGALASGNDEKTLGGAGTLAGGLAGLIYGATRHQVIPKVALRTAQNLLADTPEARQQLFAMMKNSPGIRDAISAIAARLGGVLGTEATEQYYEQRRGSEQQ